jgi:hypothetical protein
MLRSALIFLVLFLIKSLSRIFYRVEMEWIGDTPPDRWEHHRLVILLNHTSLYEPVFAAALPYRFIWRIARHGVVPAAEKTTARPIVGRLFKLVARHVVAVSRERDQTWVQVLSTIDPDSMVIILPEGRMKRRNGLDATGLPMTVRGGVADIIELIGEGRMLIAYSGGLHHVQAPGERIPRIFRTVRMRLELVEISDYIVSVGDDGGRRSFKRMVIDDLERRRDTICPPLEAMND